MGKSGGVIIIINFSETTSNIDINTEFLFIHNKNLSLYLIAIYKHPKSNDSDFLHQFD